VSGYDREGVRVLINTWLGMDLLLGNIVCPVDRLCCMYLFVCLCVYMNVHAYMQECEYQYVYSDVELDRTEQDRTGHRGQWHEYEYEHTKHSIVAFWQVLTIDMYSQSIT
jgi:hypothetical protein